MGWLVHEGFLLVYNKGNNTLHNNNAYRLHTPEYGQAAAFQDRKVVLKAHCEPGSNPKPLALSVLWRGNVFKLSHVTLVVGFGLLP